MSTRRQFLARGTALAVATGSCGLARQPSFGAQRSEYRRAEAVQAIRPRNETLKRLGGVGDCFYVTWAEGDDQLVVVNDGYGWFDRPKGFYNSRLWTLTGPADRPEFFDLPEYPELVNGKKPEDGSRYYGTGTLAVDGYIYQFLATPNHSFAFPGLQFIGSKLIFSSDGGRTWYNQNGTTPVSWERWADRSGDNMAFFKEPQNAFSLISILQMGRNYEQNKDGFIYAYAPNGNSEGTMNELVMFRVHKTQILDRSCYEFYAGMRSNGQAQWTRDIGKREVVQRFPSGWINWNIQPGDCSWGWLPSVVYVEPLNTYLMANFATGIGPTGRFYGKPSYLGFWVARNPWGPWRQVYENAHWITPGDENSRLYCPQIAPKWIAPDGKSFYLFWSDFQKAPEAIAAQMRDPDLIDAVKRPDNFRKFLPSYELHMQRFDIAVS